MMQLIYVTCIDMEEARSIAQKIIEEKLAACANILPAIESIYKWEGKLESSQEVVLLLKTKEELTKKCIAKIENLHSYKIPCAIAFKITDGSPSYLNWLSEQVKL